MGKIDILYCPAANQDLNLRVTSDLDLSRWLEQRDQHYFGTWPKRKAQRFVQWLRQQGHEVQIKPHYRQVQLANGKAKLWHGDCLRVLKRFPANSIDTVVTDPPYGLKFIKWHVGKNWDRGIPGIEYWQEILRVTKPGGHLLSFGGTRTYHRLACAIEDAGWKIKDCLAYLYGSGIPKSLDIARFIRKTDADAAKPWEGWGTTLKPGFEPIVLAMKPFEGTFANNAAAHGVAGLNINGCRIRAGELLRGGGGKLWSHYRDGTADLAVKPVNKRNGRWPANVLLVHHPECQRPAESENDWTCVPNCPVAELNRQSEGVDNRNRRVGDAGRFFPELGQDVPPFIYGVKVGKRERSINGAVDNPHPTLKPLSVMRWLCRLTKTPAGGVVLDPFMGSGTTGIAALQEGREFIGIELDVQYWQVSRDRLQAWLDQVAAVP